VNGIPSTLLVKQGKPHSMGCCGAKLAMSEPDYRYHFAVTEIIAANPETLFLHLDDQRRLSEHMSKSSWMMLGSKMNIELDDGLGAKVGSAIRLSGRVLGIAIAAEEVVTERNPPLRKTWQTVGTPKLLVIGPYRMGFDIGSHAHGSQLRVCIEFDLPAKAQWLGRLFGPMYARWCVNQMISDAARHFSPAGRSS
jgi:hypothetical protein